jgi:hypothetical protein
MQQQYIHSTLPQLSVLLVGSLKRDLTERTIGPCKSQGRDSDCENRRISFVMRRKGKRKVNSDILRFLQALSVHGPGVKESEA